MGSLNRKSRKELRTKPTNHAYETRHIRLQFKLKTSLSLSLNMFKT